METNNKRLGTSFEIEVVEYLRKRGWWVHFITPDRRGAQPFDIVAAKNNKAMAVECKTLVESRNWFDIDRLEDNQVMALNKWLNCGNTEAYIVVKHRGRVHWIKWQKLRAERKVRMNADDNS